MGNGNKSCIRHLVFKYYGNFKKGRGCLEAASSHFTICSSDFKPLCEFSDSVDLFIYFS